MGAIRIKSLPVADMHLGMQAFALEVAQIGTYREGAVEIRKGCLVSVEMDEDPSTLFQRRGEVRFERQRLVVGGKRLLKSPQQDKNIAADQPAVRQGRVASERLLGGGERLVEAPHLDEDVCATGPRTHQHWVERNGACKCSERIVVAFLTRECMSAPGPCLGQAGLKLQRMG